MIAGTGIYVAGKSLVGDITCDNESHIAVSSNSPSVFNRSENTKLCIFNSFS